MGPGAQVLGPRDADVAALCAGVAVLLRQGMRPRTPRDGWAAYLPAPARPAHGPWAMLQVCMPARGLSCCCVPVSSPACILDAYL